MEHLRHPPPFPLPAAPAHAFALLEMLQGCLVRTHALPAPLTLLGRDADACALPLTDASASRVHCALAYHATTQALLACDQGSANGTYLQKVRLAAGAWTPLREGSQLRCGTDAQRVFVVSAPAGSASGQAAPAPRHAEEVVVGIASGEEAEAAMGVDPRSSSSSNSSSSSAAPLRLGQGGASGGAGGAPAGHWLAALDWVGLTEKEREAVKRLQGRLQRLAALRLEAARIQAKEASQAGLTEGQLAQLTKLQDSIAALVEVVGEEDGGLRQRIEARRNPGAAAAAAAAGGAAGGGAGGEGERELPSAWLRDSEEEVKDVSMRRGGPVAVTAAASAVQRRAFTFSAKAATATSTSAAPAPAAAPPPPPRAALALPPFATTGAVETEATLCKRLTAIRRRLMELRAAMAEAGEEARSLTTATGGASTDALDVFVERTASTDALAWLERMRIETEGLEQEKVRLEELLALVRPLQLEAAAVEEVVAAAQAAVEEVVAGEGGAAAGGAAAAAAAAAAEPIPPSRPAYHVPPPPPPQGLAALLSGTGNDSQPPPSKRPRPSNTSSSSGSVMAAAVRSEAGAPQYDAEPEDLTRFQ